MLLFATTWHMISLPQRADATVLITLSTSTLLYCTLQVHGTCANADTLLAIAASIHDADELLELAVAERDTVLAAAAARGASGLQELRDMQQRDARAELAAAATAAAAISSSSNSSSGAAAVRHDATADRSDSGRGSNSKASRRDREPL
jgi:peptidoglycan hydrolase CwlO-like protein